MTISTDHIVDVFVSQGGLRYDVDWQVLQSGGKSELRITVLDNNGNEGAPLVEGVDYSVVVDRLGEGATIFLTKAVSAGLKVKILSTRPYEQRTHFKPGVAVDPIQLEGNLDDNVIQHLQLEYLLDGKVNAGYDPATGLPAKITIDPMQSGHIPVYEIKTGTTGGKLVDSGLALSSIATDAWIKAPIDKDWVLVSQANPSSPTGYAYVPHSITEFATNRWIDAPSSSSKVLVSGPSSTSHTGFQYNEAPLAGFITTADMTKPNAENLVPISVKDPNAPAGYKYDFTPKTSFITTGELQPATAAGQILYSVPDSGSSTGFSYHTHPEEFSWIKPPTAVGNTVTSITDPTSPTGFSYTQTPASSTRILDSTGVIKGLQVTEKGYDAVTIGAGSGLYVTTEGLITTVNLTSPQDVFIPVTVDGPYYVYLNENGSAGVKFGHPDPSEFYDRLFLSAVTVVNGAVDSVTPYRLEDRNVLSSVRELADFRGPKTDVALNTEGAGKFKTSDGYFQRFGAEGDDTTPQCHTIILQEKDDVPFRFVYLNESGTDFKTAMDGSALPYEDVATGAKGDIPIGDWGVYPITLTPVGKLVLGVSQGKAATPAGLQKIVDSWIPGNIFKRNAYLGFIALQSGVNTTDWGTGHIFVASNRLTSGRLPSSSGSTKGSAEGITDANSVINGLVMSIDPTGQSISITSGQAMFIDPADLAAGPKIVNAPAASAITVPRISDTDFSFVYLKKDGTYEVTQSYQNTARGDKLLLGVLEHTDNTDIRFIRHLALNSDAIPKQIYDIYGMLGNQLERLFMEKSVLNTDAFVTFDGVFKGFGVNPTNKLDYSEVDVPGQDPTPFRIRKLDGSQSAVLNALTAGVITELDDKTPLGNNKLCYLPIFVYPNGKMYLQAPQQQFNDGQEPSFEEWYGKYKFESGLVTNGALRAVLKYKQGTALSDPANVLTIVTDKGFGSLPGGGASSPLPIPNPDGSDVGKNLAVQTGNVYGLSKPAVVDPSAKDKILLSVTDATSPTGFKYQETDKSVLGLPTPDAPDQILVAKPDATSPTGFSFQIGTIFDLTGKFTVPGYDRIIDTALSGGFPYSSVYSYDDYVKNIAPDTFFTVEIEVEVNAAPSAIVDMSASAVPYVGKKIGLGAGMDSDHYIFTGGSTTAKLTVKRIIGQAPIINDWYFSLEQSPTLLPTAQRRPRYTPPGAQSNGGLIDLVPGLANVNEVLRAISVRFEFEKPVILKQPQSQSFRFGSITLMGEQNIPSSSNRKLASAITGDVSLLLKPDGTWSLGKPTATDKISGIKSNAVYLPLFNNSGTPGPFKNLLCITFQMYNRTSGTGSDVVDLKEMEITS